MVYSDQEKDKLGSVHTLFTHSYTLLPYCGWWVPGKLEGKRVVREKGRDKIG